MQAYRIVDWEQHYENNRTREMKVMQWVPVPIKHDGYGYGLLVAKNGAARLGAWLAILQTAAKSHPRGTLLRDGRHPHTAATIAVKTRIPEQAIREAIDECLRPEIGWLEVVDIQGDRILPAEIPQEGAGISQDPARKGREGKGKERNHEGVVLPFDSPEFRRAWSDWKEHRRKIGKAMTDRAQELGLAKLPKQEADAIRWIDNAIEKGWRGLYEPKDEPAKSALDSWRNQPAEAAGQYELIKQADGTEIAVPKKGGKS